jgi:hypothetical protein
LRQRAYSMSGSFTSMPIDGAAVDLRGRVLALLRLADDVNRRGLERARPSDR